MDCWRLRTKVGGRFVCKRLHVGRLTYNCLNDVKKTWPHVGRQVKAGSDRSRTSGWRVKIMLKQNKSLL